MNKINTSFLTILLFLGFALGTASGQEMQQPKRIKIESVVVDENNKPIPNALITGYEGTVEAFSGKEGKFAIEVPASSSLLIEAKGFKDTTLIVGPEAGPITLMKQRFLMDEDHRVNIAFGQVSKKELVNSVSYVNIKDINGYDNAQYFYNALGSRIPGLLGGSNIRGIGSALFIVDGFPRDPSDINLEEVEQITVLKDANAAVLWGTQARNGVVIVTTKRGQAYKRRINVSVEQGISKPIVLPKYLGSADYMNLYNEALANDGLPAAWADTTIAHYAAGTNPYRYPSVDYYSSEYLRDYKPFTRLATEFSGGNDATQYFTSVGWMHSGSLYALGTGRDASDDRFNVRCNVNLKINDYIKSHVNALVVVEGNKRPNGNFWGNAATLHPNYYSPLLPASLIKHDAEWPAGGDLATSKLIRGGYILGGTSQYTDNAYGNMFLGGYTQTMRRTARVNMGIDIDLRAIAKGLQLKTLLSTNIYNTYFESVENTYAIYQPTWTYHNGVDSISSLKKIGTDLNTGVQNLDDGGFTRSFGTYAALDYARSFGKDHSFSGTFLAYFDNLTQSAVIINEKNSHLGLRLNYDFRKRLFVDFSSAYVNGFKLEKGRRGELSPTLGLAWAISDNAKEKGLVNYLKLKASAGIINYEFTGDDYRLYESTFISGSNYSWFDGQRSIPQTDISRSGNPDLTFEKMKNVNIGLEGCFLNRSLWLDAGVFYNRNSGLLVRRGIYAPYIGNSYPYENYGIIDYKGAELGLNWTEQIGQFSFDLGANVLLSNSEKIKVDEIWSNAYQYRQGKARDALFGLEALGFFVDDADISGHAVQEFGEVRPGDIKYRDQNNDGKINTDDEIQIGNKSDLRISYGLSLTMKYKGLSLFAIGNGRSGSDNFYDGAYFWIAGNDKYSEEVLNRWKPETAATATYPRLSSKASPNNFRYSTFWMYRDDYFSLDRVQLSLNLPKRLAYRIATKDLILYIKGENLARLSKDATKRQIRTSEPAYRNYAVGLRIMF
ncbi:MAG: SusC/RagA family TonB-linked outer membrane protein [Prolixibacteraceae bacterium]